jgi:hypothetical protein
MQKVKSSINHISGTITSVTGDTVKKASNKPSKRLNYGGEDLGFNIPDLLPKRKLRGLNT